MVSHISERPLEGARFSVYGMDDKQAEGITTDENGIAISSDLKFGAYYIKEMEAPEGYVLNEEQYYFSITNDEEIIEFNVVNDPIKGKVEVLKTDSETGKKLSGTVIGIYNLNDNLILEIETDENGYAISSFLLYGDYYLKEISSPEGYMLTDEEYHFKISGNDQIISLDIPNEIIKGKVKLVKTEPLDGYPLKGVGFGVINSEDILIEEIFTDESGMAVSADLVYGDYYIQELSFPDGYIPDDAKYSFSILENEKIIELYMQNTPVSGSVEVYYKHIDCGHEIFDSYVYSDWAGKDYLHWIESKGLDKKELSGYTFIKADYSNSEELTDGKLTITYWYDDEINEGSWNEVAIPKTGQEYPWIYYIVAVLCFVFAFLIFCVLRFRYRVGGAK